MDTFPEILLVIAGAFLVGIALLRYVPPSTLFALFAVAASWQALELIEHGASLRRVGMTLLITFPALSIWYRDLRGRPYFWRQHQRIERDQARQDRERKG